MADPKHPTTPTVPPTPHSPGSGTRSPDPRPAPSNRVRHAVSEQTTGNSLGHGDDVCVMIIDDLETNRMSAAMAAINVLNKDHNAGLDTSLIQEATDVDEESPLVTDHLIVTHNHNDARIVLEQLKADGKPLPTVVVSDNDTPEVSNGINWIKELEAEQSPLKVVLVTGGTDAETAKDMQRKGCSNIIGVESDKLQAGILRESLKRVLNETQRSAG